MRAPTSIIYNPECDPERMHHYKHVRFVEHADRGLRRVGFADIIAREEGSRCVDHKGWFIEDDGLSGEAYRGVVYQLPARDGKPQYVYGYADPHNDECALLSFDSVSDKLEAAKQADRFAELFAEQERDYNRAWQAGRKYEELADEIKDMRKEALAIGAEMREARRTVVNAPTICATLRKQIVKLYHSIQKARKERHELYSDFGRCEGFVE